MQIMDIPRADRRDSVDGARTGSQRVEAANGASALIPAILGGFKKQAQAQPAGMDSIVGMLGGLGGGGLMDEVLAPQPTNVGQATTSSGRSSVPRM